MDFDDLSREGERPAIIPNSGSRQTLCWTLADHARLGEVLKAVFPDIVFYEDFRRVNTKEEKPNVRFVERLDDPAIGSDFDRNFPPDVEAFFPYPGWSPDLVRVKCPYNIPTPFPYHWTWARYLSPQVSFTSRGAFAARRSVWNGLAKDKPIEFWPRHEITTSYRRELQEERRLEAKVIRITRKLCVRTVPVCWGSYEDFLAGQGRVYDIGIRTGDGWASKETVDWCRAGAQRVLQLVVTRGNWACGSLPIDLVPDSWWGDIPKPKWAQRL